MEFSNTSTKSGLIEDVTFLLGIDTNAYSLKDRTRNMNQRYAMVWQMIFESYGGWQFTDTNVADQTPYADQTLTSGTGTYTLPTAGLTIRGVEIMVTANAWQRLNAITREQFLDMGGDTLLVATAVPWGYMLNGNKITLVPTPNYTLASALRIFFDQGINTFVYTDTTAVPGFASPFHRMLSVGCALDYALARGMTEQATFLQALWNDYEKRLKDYYSKRFLDRFPANIGAGTDLVREFS